MVPAAPASARQDRVHEQSRTRRHRRPGVLPPAPDLGVRLATPTSSARSTGWSPPPARGATWWSGSCTPSPARGTVFDPALGHVRLIDGLAPATGEPTLVKTSHNAFTTTNLQQLLTRAGIREVTVCGIRTEQCVETTTRVGARPRLPDDLRDRRHGDLPHPAPGPAGGPPPSRRSSPTRAPCPTEEIDRPAPSTPSPAGSPPSAPSTRSPARAARRAGADAVARVVFLLVPQLHLLDLAGPAQVFSSAADLGYDYRLHYVAERDRGADRAGRTAAGRHPVARAGPRTTWWSYPAGGRAAHGPAGPVGAGDLRRLADHHARGGTVASVCAGAFALGRAGLLDGRRCTTHHEVQDELARRHPGGPGGPRRAVRGRRPGGHLGRHRQRHRRGAAPGGHPARPGGRRPDRPHAGRVRPAQRRTSSRPAR